MGSEEKSSEDLWWNVYIIMECDLVVCMWVTVQYAFKLYDCLITISCIPFALSYIIINNLKTKRILLYLKTQFVPRSKHFSSRL
jgi:hypothetical protein